MIQNHVVPPLPQLVIARREKGQSRDDATVLTPADIAADPAATAAARTVSQFDAFLAANGAPVQAYRAANFVVELYSGRGGGASELRDGRDVLELCSGGSRYRFHTATDAELMGHELAHGVQRRLGVGQGDEQAEAWADVVGNAFARSIAAPNSNDWHMFETAQPIGKAGGYVRDLEHPVIGNAAELPKALAWGVEPVAHDMGLLSRAATIVAAHTTPAIAGEIFTGALLIDSAARWGHPTVGELNRSPVAMSDNTDIARVVGGLAYTARATLDAAVRLFGKDAPAFAAVNDAWNAVGINPEWEPLDT